MNDFIKRSDVLQEAELMRPVMSFNTDAREAVDVGRIIALPTADVEEVRHGEWKTTVSTVFHNNGEQSTYYGCRCTVCKEDADKSFLFCPNCGAKMDGKEQRNGQD